MDMILKKPLISEKSLKMAKANVYTFLVNKMSRKTEIAELIEAKFSVDVLSIKTANFKDQRKIQRSRKGFYTATGYKKAMVELKSGQKIDLFETEAAVQQVEEEVKEKKSLLKGTKVKVERGVKKNAEGVSKDEKKEKKASK